MKNKEKRKSLIQEKRKIRDLIVDNFNIKEELFDSPYKKEIDSLLVGIFSSFDKHVHIRSIQVNLEEFDDIDGYIKLVLSRPLIDEDEDHEILCEHWDEGTLEIRWDSEGYICFAEKCFDWAQNENFTLGTKSIQGGSNEK